jgi:hypothetical protein
MIKVEKTVSGILRQASLFTIYESFMPCTEESDYPGCHAFNFFFSDGRVTELIICKYPRRIAIKRWCDVTLNEFLAIMKKVYESLSLID